MQPWHSSLFSAVTRLTGQAREKGLHLTVSDDFDALIEAAGQAVGRGPVAPAFDPRVSELGAQNGFWVLGTDERGRVGHLQAVRMIDTGRRTLRQHIDAHLLDFAPPLCAVDPDGSASEAPAANAFGGRLCYHGELWLRGGAEGFRGRGLSAALTRLGIVLAYLRWSPAVTFALVSSWSIEKALTDAYGYINAEPRGAVWSIEGRTEKQEEWLVWVTPDQLGVLLEADERSDLPWRKAA